MPKDKQTILTGQNTGSSHSGIHSTIYKSEDKPAPPIQDSASYNTEVSDVEFIARNFYSPIYRPLTARIQYPHIALGSFARAFRDYIHYGVYDKFNGIVFGAYNKAIQNYLQLSRANETGVVDIGLPIFSYTFQIEGVDEKVDMPWRNTTFLPGLSKGLYDSFYIDNDFELKVIYRRLKGNINSTIYCNSEAEVLDIQMAFFDGFRGTNVYNKTDIRALTILPNQLMFTDYMGRRLGRALSGNQITKAFIPSVNSEQYYIYTNLSAIINMSSISQNSNYYGGSNIPEYSLNATFNYEIDIPQYILCLVRKEYVSIEINLDVSYKYEDRRVLNAIHYITGKHTNVQSHDTIHDLSRSTFENGEIIDSVAFIINNDNMNKIHIPTIFPGKRTWHYLNKDIVLLIVYSGGVIRCPYDEDAMYYDAPIDTIMIRKDLFNVDDFVEVFVFKYNDAALARYLNR